jgi:hypothetical protein
LLNGRIYLTNYHLCFKSTTLGIKTRKIYALDKIIHVEKGATKKKDDALSIVVDNTMGREMIGYGGLLDRDGLYDALMEAQGTLSTERSRESTPEDSSKHIPVFYEDEEGGLEEGVATSPTDIANPSIPINHLSELAIDTIIKAPVDKVFNLIYHNQEFIVQAYEKNVKLSGEFLSTANIPPYVRLSSSSLVSTWAPNPLRFDYPTCYLPNHHSSSSTYAPLYPLLVSVSVNANPNVDIQISDWKGDDKGTTSRSVTFVMAMVSALLP